MTPTRLPVVLESLKIASPCSADWEDMGGDDRVRFCGRCEKNVYNLSVMSRLEAEALVAEKEGKLCVRFFQRTDGTVLTNDCPVGVRRMRLRQRVWASIAGAATSAALVLGLFGGRARADLTVGDSKAATKAQPKRTVVRAGGLAPRQPEMMGKIAIQGEPAVVPPPKPPQPLMGAPVAMQGDVAPADPRPKTTAKPPTEAKPATDARPATK
jgi:hypothetical protein